MWDLGRAPSSLVSQELRPHLPGLTVEETGGSRLQTAEEHLQVTQGHRLLSTTWLCCLSPKSEVADGILLYPGDPQQSVLSPP